MKRIFFMLLLALFLVDSLAYAQDVDYDPNNPKASDSAGIFGYQSGNCPPVRALDGPLQLVINHDGQEPVINLVLDPKQRYPVFFDVGRIYSDTLRIEAYLPPEIPNKFPTPPEFRPPDGNFTLLVVYRLSNDTAEYRVSFSGDPLTLNVETVRHAEFLRLQKLRQKPENIALLIFSSYDQAMGAKKKLKKYVKCTRLKPGNYEGIPFLIAKGEHGMNEVPCRCVILAVILPKDAEKRRLAEEQLSRYQVIG
ncbi:MAG: hypothetical protein AB1483_13855 [Candidatus Zixiibacteriota bacterium]